MNCDAWKSAVKSAYVIALLVVWALMPGRGYAADELEPNLRGDAEALKRVARMLDEMGGSDLWARSNHLYIEQSGWFTGPTEAATELAYRSLVSPEQMTHIVGRHTDTKHVVATTGAFTNRKGVITDMSAEDFADRQATWSNGSYTMLRRLASADQEIYLQFVEPHRVSILDADGEEISWYDINEYGHWMKWGRGTSPDVRLEYVYGPPRDFGNLRFPAWGASVDAFWRYDYEVVKLVAEPIPAELLQRPD